MLIKLIILVYYLTEIENLLNEIPNPYNNSNITDLNMQFQVFASTAKFLLKQQL